MLTTSRYLNGGSPVTCRFCSQPFKIEDNHFRAWHGQDGSFFCSSDCETDALEAKAKRLRFLS
jgi:hypothetical protein